LQFSERQPVKSWKETAEVFRRLVDLLERGRRAALATVIRVEGSAYRRPGAKLLVEDGGATLGSVSGGCLEADVREAAFAVLRDGTTRRLHYDTGAGGENVWGLGLGCRGKVDVFVQAADDPGVRGAAGRALELFGGSSPFEISTVVGGAGRAGLVRLTAPDGSLTGSLGDEGLDREARRSAAAGIAGRQSRLEALGGVEVFTDVLVPAPHLVVCGADDDAIPLCRYASDAGFRVVVADHRATLLSQARFPGAERRMVLRPEDGTASLPIGPLTQAVVKTHSLVLDREWVRALLAAGVAYVAVLGPRARTEEMLRGIGAGGDERVFGPAGLDLGAEGPEQVALAIVAELLAVRGGRRPRHLRDKENAIHAGPA
jgi:xanthine dehydrogenase accessory factor